jgi:hypothetical protein
MGRPLNATNVDQDETCSNRFYSSLCHKLSPVVSVLLTLIV